MNELFEKLSRDLYSNDWDKIIFAADELARLGGDENITVLISAISSSFPDTTCAAALALRKLKVEQAKLPLIEAIKNPINKDETTPLMLALINLDNRDLWLFFIHMALYGNYGTQSLALSALQENSFIIDQTQIVVAKNEISSYLKNFSEKPKRWRLLIKNLNNIVNEVTCIINENRKLSGVRKEGFLVCLGHFQEEQKVE